MVCGNMSAFLATFVVVIVLNSDAIQAKRGCSNFGHSCYGGMGKRGSDALLTNEEVLQDVQQPNEDSMVVYPGPHSPQHDREYQQRFSQQRLFNLSPILRQWLQSYRKTEETNNDRI